MRQRRSPTPRAHDALKSADAISIGGNDVLDIAGLPALESVVRYIFIHDSPMLSGSLDLAALTQVDSLYFNGDPLLEQIVLTAPVVETDLVLFENGVLQSVAGLDAITSLSGKLLVDDCNQGRPAHAGAFPLLLALRLAARGLRVNGERSLRAFRCK